MSDLFDLFRQTGALLEGHFVLRSGLHSRQFFQCALFLRNTVVATRACGELAAKLAGVEAEEVISAAMGGLFVGHEIARALGLPHIFAEKEDGKLVLRRNFQIPPGRRFIIAEDVVTRGGRVQETIDIVRSRGGVVAAVAVLVDRSGGKAPDFGCPFISLLQMDAETFEPDKLPPDLA
ncbi:MAG TPA: orotate phosphoribosyltransferase, partial [Chthoniobacteraceae bacterium]